MSKKSISTAQTDSTIQTELDRDLTPSQKAAREPALAMLRELVKTYQAFYSYDDAHIRQLGLTMPQFDVIATLGNTNGMMMSQLAEKTLVTKGTLTGIVDRLEQKGLVRRAVPPDNRRCFIVMLTPAGQQLFEDIFPTHIEYLKERLSNLSTEEMEQLQMGLRRLRQLF